MANHKKAAPCSQKSRKQSQCLFLTCRRRTACYAAMGRVSWFTMYRGQKNLGIISLNTMDIAYIGINQYYDNSILIEKPAEHFSTSIRTSKESGFSSMVSQNSNRGYATGSITFLRIHSWIKKNLPVPMRRMHKFRTG